ncbi:hypothetical protein [Caballeronia arationis]|uniref:hypothetical protein n=1 Tax=Caballeronia arationis TaxID=1777142 RepID=UPI000A666B90|nr:hypothetical protein [Caballeronia arationis]
MKKLSNARLIRETLVHEIGSAADLPDTYRLLRVEVGERVKIAELGEGALPEDWRENPSWTQASGSEWLPGGATALLSCPALFCPSRSTTF